MRAEEYLGQIKDIDARLRIWEEEQHKAEGRSIGTTEEIKALIAMRAKIIGQISKQGYPYNIILYAWFAEGKKIGAIGEALGGYSYSHTRRLQKKALQRFEKFMSKNEQ